jgi:hypothetical protein
MSLLSLTNFINMMLVKNSLSLSTLLKCFNGYFISILILISLNFDLKTFTKILQKIKFIF